MRPPVPALAAFLFLITRTVAVDAPDFNREVRPILSNYCFQCHGPDDKTRKAKLRLDLPEEAVKPAKSGDRAIVPGHLDESELITRILSEDDDDRMPPPAVKKVMTAAQKEVLQRWVASGAKSIGIGRLFRPNRRSCRARLGNIPSTHSCVRGLHAKGCSHRRRPTAQRSSGAFHSTSSVFRPRRRKQTPLS